MIQCALSRQWIFHQGTATTSAAVARRYLMMSLRSSCSTSTSPDITSSVLSGDDNDDGDKVNVKNNGSILFLSPSNWPEPNATAAGTRTMSLLHHFSDPMNSLFSSVHFGCGAKIPQTFNNTSNHDNGEGSSSRIHWHCIKPNRTEEMKSLLQNIEKNHGPIRAVAFDRFYAEEAFSFSIRELCPNALLVLDMQDIHSLRLGRQCQVEEMDKARANGQSIDNNSPTTNTNNEHTISMTKQLMNKVMEFDPPSINDDGSSKRKKAYDTFLRELASVHRSDLVLVCSSVEMKLLESWGVPKWKLVPASFFCMEAQDDHDTLQDEDGTDESLSKHAFEDRKDFVTVGGFKHAPNVDSVQLLRDEIWPRIRKRLPDARIHIYGAYPTSQILAMHDEKTGFHVHGQVDDIDEVLLKSRVLLAPLRFGAGCKGKIVDAWRCGCPVVTTPVGAEGMTDDSNQDVCDTDDAVRSCWGGLIASDTNDFVDAAVEVYTQKDLWGGCRDEGAGLLKQLFDGRVNIPVVEGGIRDGIVNLRKRRQLNVVAAMLWRDSQRSTEYFSRWIELKESLAANVVKG